MAIFVLFATSCDQPQPTTKPLVTTGDNGNYHVHPGDDIQKALDLAAGDSTHKTVIVHAGVYRPARRGQAFVRFNERHDGITLVANGNVTLTAANPTVANPSETTYPAIVNHIVYFGHGVSNKTILRGFRLTGANGYNADAASSDPIEPHASDPRLELGMFFYSDGGAVKIFGSSSPQLHQLEIVDNTAALCGGGVSIEQRGYSRIPVTIKDCIFKNNKCPATGSGLDILSYSSADVENCLFVNNIANTGMDEIQRRWGLVHNPQHGCGALTVFPDSQVQVRRCTFTRNWNGVDDRGKGNVYSECVFWMNTAGDGSRPGGPYEIDIAEAQNVRDCWIHGAIDDLQKVLNQHGNVLNAPNPQFDASYVPQAKEYQGVGYRKIEARKPAVADSD